MNDHRVRCEATSLTNRVKLASRSVIRSFGKVNDPWHASPSIVERFLNVATALERMAIAKVFHDAQRKIALVERTMPGIMMANRGDTRQQVLDPADEQTISYRNCARGSDSRIGIESRLDVETPRVRVRVDIAIFYFAKVVHGKMVVRIYKTWQHKPAVQVECEIVLARRFIERNDLAAFNPERIRERTLVIENDRVSECDWGNVSKQ